MKQRTALATLVLVLSSTFGLGCDLINSEASAQTTARSEAGSKIDAACTNLMLVIGESPERCKAEMGAFLDQCPAQSDEVLSCMTTASSPEQLDGCTKPCMMAAADEIAPPVPPERDTPQLAAACEAIGVASGGGTKAGQEACKRQLAQEVAQCLSIETEVLECYAANARSTDAMAECGLRCIGASIKAENEAKAKAEGKGKGKGKRKRGRKGKGKGKGRR